ncbi:MAG TPA: hypothetical protein VKU00_00655 [Chthonomonadaceae bacterium]|nr:hypothetical protein [Chthonomonadaceae bacterium]
MHNRFLLLPGFALLLVLGTLSPGHAQIYVKLASITPSGSDFTYTYDIVLGSGSEIQNGDFVTIYDCRSLVPGTNTQPVNWTFSSTYLGKTPTHIRAADSSSYPNLTWTYEGSEVNGPVDLGNFSVNATSGTTLITNYASQCHQNAPGGVADEKLVYMLAYTSGAHASRNSNRWWALLPLGLLPLGLLRRARML